MPIPDEKWKEVAKLLHSKNIKIAELNPEKAKAHYECQDNIFNFSKSLKVEEEKELAKLLDNPETKD